MQHERFTRAIIRRVAAVRATGVIRRVCYTHTPHTSVVVTSFIDVIDWLPCMETSDVNKDSTLNANDTNSVFKTSSSKSARTDDRM